MYSAETINRLDYLREQAQQRELTRDEAKEVISLIRQDRLTASPTKKVEKIDPLALMAKLKASLGG